MRRRTPASGFVVATILLVTVAAIWLAGSSGAPATSSAVPTTTIARATAPSAPSDPTAPDLPSDPSTTSALVDALVVAGVDPGLAPYRRDAFGGNWDYDPISGCNTRERVLIEEAVQMPDVDDRCRSTNGQWVSAYDGLIVDDVADLQIDHFVPLAEAWRSGAAAWTDARREAFSNDLDQPETLVAVTGFTNQSKSDRTPDQWLPPDRTAWCTYATDWVSVKTTWSLSVTPAEKATLVQVLAGC